MTDLDGPRVQPGAELVQIENSEPLAIHFGLESVVRLPFDRLNVFTQTRKTHSEEALQELVRSIEAKDDQGRPRNVLLHPPFVSVLDPDKADKYVDDLNKCHRTVHSLDEARPLDDSTYPVVVAGHRRRLAVGRIIAKQSADPSLSTVSSNVVYNLGFSDALRVQIEENTHLQLPMCEVARAIQSTYRYGIELGEFKSVADCVRVLPFSKTKIHEALRFCELPLFIQDWVEDDRLSYAAAVALYPAMKVFEKMFDDLPITDRNETVLYHMMTWGIRIINKGWGKDKVASQVAEFIASQQIDNNLRLFSVDEKVVARRQLQSAYRELFDGGLGRLRSFVALAGQADLFRKLPPEQQETILGELDDFRRHLGSITVSTTQGSFDD